MAGKVLTKMMGFLGLEDDLEEDIEFSDELEDKRAVNGVSEVEPILSNSKRQNKIVSIHNNISTKVKIVKPTTYEDAADICDEVKNRKIVVINTTGLEPRVAQRLLDFLGGSSYALGGDLEEIEKNVYIISPASVEVTNELKSELSGKGLFTWNK